MTKMSRALDALQTTRRVEENDAKSREGASAHSADDAAGRAMASACGMKVKDLAGQRLSECLPIHFFHSLARAKQLQIELRTVLKRGKLAAWLRLTS